MFSNGVNKDMLKGLRIWLSDIMTNNDILKDETDICPRNTTYYNFDAKFYEKCSFFPYNGIYAIHVKGCTIRHKMSLKKKEDKIWWNLIIRATQNKFWNKLSFRKVLTIKLFYPTWLRKKCRNKYYELLSLQKRSTVKPSLKENCWNIQFI